MRWRSIGPFRAGRVSAVSGIPGNAVTFYMASAGGGVWKTTDGGVEWKPIFDAEDVGSVGALVVAPSDANVVYAGTGDVSLVGGAVNIGDGVYRSADAGRTWAHAGLPDSAHIGNLWVDPTDANVVVAAVLGKTYAPGPDRGIYKTTDGGKTWRKVLYTDPETGGIDVTFAPGSTRVGYATLWHHIGKAANPFQLIDDNSGGAIYKTTDGGDTWTELHLPGVAAAKLGRIGVATAKGGQLVFAIVSSEEQGRAGLYRSDDGGANWRKITDDPRVTGNGYFSRVFLDPKNPDVVYVAQTSLYRSTDGGKTFISYKGAPGGDDNHALWIDPTDPSRMIMASDQGATISQDGGHTWSSWYNQPTGQMYHMSTDNRFAYWVYGTQQDSGSVGTLSRGDYGDISFLDWDPVAAYEFGYIVPDPKNPELVFAGGPARGLVLVNRSNRQVQTISPNVDRDGDFRLAMNPPLAFSPQDPSIFYEGTQYLLETRDQGRTWTKISPDLTSRPGNAERNAKSAAQDKAETAQTKALRTEEVKETLKLPNRTAINAFSPSPKAAGEIWAGTTNGLVQLTRDNGKSWQPVTPPGLTQYSIISMVEASHFDPAVAYVSVDRHEENDRRAYIFRTADYGKTWTRVDAGIPDGDFVRVVREDPKRSTLLYAGTENGSWVSFDQGKQWSSLRLNMPVVSVRDLQVHGDDLVAATYGRAFWILDDVSPLRQIDAAVAPNHAFLYQPAKAVRVQFDQNGDTPFPPEMPAASNPPDGALIDYYLLSAPNGDIKLAIYDSKGALVREYSSQPIPPNTEPPPHVPDYWLAKPAPLPRSAGMHRFLWDLRYTRPDSLAHHYEIAAIEHETQPEPQGALVVPGEYQVRLTVNGKTYQRPLQVAIDPRVSVTPAALQQQFALERKAAALTSATYTDYNAAAALHDAIMKERGALKDTSAPVTKTLQTLDDAVAKAEGKKGGGGFSPKKPKPSFGLLNGEFGSLATLVDSADAEPTAAMQTAFADYCKDLATVTQTWNGAIHQQIDAVNQELTAQHQPALHAAPMQQPSACQ